VGGAPVISVTGDVDLATAPTLQQTLLDVTGDPTGQVIVDLTDCSFLDARGLSALLVARESLGRAGRPLTLVLSNPTMLGIFQATGLDKRFEIFPSLSEVGERSHE
jgi:anti-sigma B factor antagonist